MTSENKPKAKGKAPPHAWKPGQSGNPGGRPKLREHVRERSAAAVDEHCVAAWIEEVVTRGDDWVKCSELLAAYGIGKPGSAPEDLDALKASSPLSGATTEAILKAMRGEE